MLLLCLLPPSIAKTSKTVDDWSVVFFEVLAFDEETVPGITGTLTIEIAIREAFKRRLVPHFATNNEEDVRMLV